VRRPTRALAAQRALNRLIEEIERLRSDAAAMEEDRRILDQAIAHNATLDRDEIAYWKDRSNEQ
jgi:hypothetical protein